MSSFIDVTLTNASRPTVLLGSKPASHYPGRMDNALFPRPEAFNRDVAVSLVTRCADRFVLGPEALSALHLDSLNPNVLMDVDALEEAADAHATLVSNFQELTRSMDRRWSNSLSLTHIVPENKAHMSVFGPAPSCAVRSICLSLSREKSWANLDEE